MKAQPYQPHRIQRLIPGIPQPTGQIQILDGEVHAVKLACHSILIGNRVLFHMKIRKRHLFALPFHHQIVGIAGIELQQHGKIRLDVDCFPVQLHNAVTDLQPLRAVDGAKWLKAADHRRDFLLDGEINQDHQQHAHGKIHRGARHQND